MHIFILFQVKANDEEVVGEATWDEGRYCAIWTPLGLSIWPVGESHSSIILLDLKLQEQQFLWK